MLALDAIESNNTQSEINNIAQGNSKFTWTLRQSNSIAYNHMFRRFNTANVYY